MFDIAQRILVWVPIKWPGVKQTGNELAEPTTHEIEAQVELVDAARLKEIFGGDGIDSQLTELEKFRALVSDWRGVVASGASAPMTDENIKALLRVPMFAAGFERSYIDAWTGQLELREKNSSDSSGAGQADGANAKPKTKAA